MGPVSRPGAGAEAHLAEGGGGGRRGRGCEEAAAGRGGRGRGRGPGAGPGWASAVPAPASCHAVSRCCHGVSRPGMGLVTSWWLGWLLADWVQIMLAWPPPPRQYPAPRYRAALPTLPGRTARPAPAAAAVSGAGPRPLLSWCGCVLGGGGAGRGQAASCLSVVRCSARATEAGPGCCWSAGNMPIIWEILHTTTTPSPPPPHHHHLTTNTQTDLQLNRYRICQNLPGCHLKTLGGGTETGSLYRRD